MSTLTHAQPTTLRQNLVQGPAATPVMGKRDPIWPALVVAGGLLASVAWSGLLVWMVGRLMHIW